MDFVWLLMSNSELLRIKNKQKTTYKKQKTASSYKKYRKRPNDRFGFKRAFHVNIDMEGLKQF